MTLLILVVDDELLRRTRWFVRRTGAQHTFEMLHTRTVVPALFQHIIRSLENCGWHDKA
jgi:hypothetical protein